MSSRNYIVRDVTPPSFFSGRYGDMASYELRVVADGEAEQSVELVQKKETNPPQIGQTIYGHIEPPKDPKYAPKLKKDQRPNQGGGYTNKGSGNTRSGSSDDQRDSIERQVAYKSAVELVAAVSGPGTGINDLKEWTSELFRHGLALIQNKPEVRPPSPPAPQRPAPQEQPPPPPEPSGGDNDRFTLTIDHLRDAYKGFQEQKGQMEADRLWRQKLTSMGLTVETLEQATHDQRSDLFEFLDPTPF